MIPQVHLRGSKYIEVRHEKDIEDLSVERDLNSDTGEVTLRFMYKGKSIPGIPLVGDVAEQLSGLTLISKDLNSARRWIEEASKLFGGVTAGEEDRVVWMKEREPGDKVKALFVAALTFYAKAFTEAAGRRAQMARDWLDSEYREPHDFYMSYRHNLAAHSGDEKYEVAESYILLIPHSSGIGFRLYTSRSQPDYAGDRDLDHGFAQLIEHAISKVDERYNKMAERLLSKASQIEIKYLKMAAHSGKPMDATRLIRRRAK